MRRILARTALIASIAALAACAPAFGQGAFSPLPSATPDTTPTATSGTVTSTNDQGGLKTWQEIALFAAGLALIAGIAYAIMADARKLAPVSDADSFGHESSTTSARKVQSKDQARKRAKAARAARKRNR